MYSFILDDCAALVDLGRDKYLYDFENNDNLYQYIAKTKRSKYQFDKHLCRYYVIKRFKIFLY